MLGSTELKCKLTVTRASGPCVKALLREKIGSLVSLEFRPWAGGPCHGAALMREVVAHEIAVGIGDTAALKLLGGVLLCAGPVLCRPRG